ncbi:MAG TPA: hypothetical protein VG347_13315 [Verrucomicrobiae bacterium]|nr:hypothetical protein [Verrucomicrobiae bacterium]
MSSQPQSELSPNQQAMLDLALACDLKASKTEQHDAIRVRHKAIKTQKDAANYVHEVEGKIHGKRQFPRITATTSTNMTTSSNKPKPAVAQPNGMHVSLAIIVLVAFMVTFGWFAPAGFNLVLVTLCMGLMLMVLGISITKNPLGVLINDRNLMSLSRFQMAVWTVVVLGAYFTFAMVRIRALSEGSLNGQPVTDPLNITIDWHLWALLGISTTSLVGAPLILSSKKDKQPTDSAMTQAAKMVDEPKQEVMDNKQGTLYANTNISDARMTDMFQGDELANTAQIDVAKVQMFYFTIIAALCFFVMVLKQLVAGSSALSSLPLLPEGFVAILGISHAGYLTSKSISHTKEQS